MWRDKVEDLVNEGTLTLVQLHMVDCKNGQDYSEEYVASINSVWKQHVKPPITEARENYILSLFGITVSETAGSRWGGV